MMKRLIFFTGVYDTLDIFTYELQAEFLNMGYETMIFDVRDMQGSLRKLADFVSKPVKAVITFNNLGFNMELAPGKNVWEDLQIPCINILMDHPFCYHQAMKMAPANGIVLCTDRNHMRYLQRFYPNIAITGFLPHAGKLREEELKPISERQTDILYAGGLSKSFAANVMPDYTRYTDFDAEQVCKNAYRELLQHPWKTTEQALEECLMEEGIRMPDEELRTVISDLHVVDLYAASYYREQTLQVLAEAGMELYIYGYGWDDCKWIQRPNVHYGGRISAEEAVRKMQDAKIVLSTMTWFKDGTHDRIFNGMLQKAVTVSDSSVYMKEEFCGTVQGEETDQREMALFELPELYQLPTLIHNLLEDQKAAQKIADRGYQRAYKEHTWAVRAHELETDLLNQL